MACEPLCEATTSARLTCLTYVDEKTPEALFSHYTCFVMLRCAELAATRCRTWMPSISRALCAEQVSKPEKLAAGRKSKRKAGQIASAAEVPRQQNGAQTSAWCRFICAGLP